MRNPLRRLAGAVLANALILTAVAAPAMAQSESPSSDTSVTTTTVGTPTSTSSPTATSESSASSTTTPTTPTTSSSSSTTTSSSETSVPGSTTTSAPTSSGSTTTTTVPTTTSGTDEPGPDEPPYVDDVAHGIDLDPKHGLGLLIIACAAGEPRDVKSPDFEILEGPHQDEVDGRYWLYVVQLRDGLTFENEEVVGYWECGGETPGGGGAPVAPVPGSGGADDWQEENGGDAQVAFAPPGGVETGFGGTARS